MKRREEIEFCFGLNRTDRSTHCYKGYMSPLVDWDAVAFRVK